MRLNRNYKEEKQRVEGDKKKETLKRYVIIQIDGWVSQSVLCRLLIIAGGLQMPTGKVAVSSKSD